MSTLRRLVRKLAPMPLRLAVAVTRRTWSDWRNPPTFANETLDHATRANLKPAVTITQPIRRTAHFEGKLHNLTLAAHKLDGLRVSRGATVSFWRIIGRPSEARGFQTGRAIVNDRLGADIGGGLCQVASLLYELGLRGGATTVERHPHSRDLYTQDTRFTPLGLDAAIVWGFKDVRWTNPHPYEVVLAFHVEGETLHGSMLASAPLPTYDLEIKSQDEGTLRHVEVTRGATVSRETYVIDAS
ncbi:MAG: VanW family protein [Alphaproteobacteria bacterium]|nr:VanW family protein [Alphaproteobacteria bacterium]